MAKLTLICNKSFCIFQIFVISTLFLLSLCTSRSFISKTKLSTLNVISSLQKLHLKSSNLPNHNEQYSKNSKTSLSLRIHSKIYRNDKDYKLQLLSRLAHDSTRLKSIQNRLDRAFEPNIKAPIISGTSQGSGEYFSRVGIGQPPNLINVIIDTGSDLSWVQCQPCSQCYDQPDPIFDATQSSSYESIPCNSTICNALDESECNAGSCTYGVSYGDGSYTTGEFITETITFDGGTTVDEIAIGCGHNNDGFFTGAGGLLGLGGGALSLPSQLNATSFSYCLVDREDNSTSYLNFNTNSTMLPSDPTIITAPLLSNPLLETFYYVGLIGLSVGGTTLPIPATNFVLGPDGSGGVIIDTGTAVSRLEEQIYQILRDEFRRGSEHLQMTDEVAIFDTCYDLRGQESVEVPTLELHFNGGMSLTLPARNYLIPVDTEGTFCLAFAPTTTSMSIIGNVQQEGIRVGINLVYSLVTFEPHEC